MLLMCYYCFMEEKIHIVALLGSLRKDSFNKVVLQTAIELCPQDAYIEIADIAKLPLFNGDFENQPSLEIAEFKARIKSADAILFVTPEYNYSIPGGLKNAIDIGSRPYMDNSWEGKPVAIMTASPGMLGGSRAQYQLRQTFVFLNMFPINKPEVIISNVQEKIADGKIIDQITKDKITEQLNELVTWTKKLKS